MSKLRVTGLREVKPSVTGGFPSPRASNAEHVDDVIKNIAYPTKYTLGKLFVYNILSSRR